MSCFPCFGSKESEEEVPAEVPVAQVIDAPATPLAGKVNDPPDSLTDVTKNDTNATENNNSRTFTFRELLMATKNFKQETLIGEEGFGKLYKGKLQCGEVVSVKHLDKNGTQGNKEFLVEVSILTLLNHPNLVKLIGYCADGDQRLLVYEFMSFGSLDSHLHDISDDIKVLDWQTRMKIASGVAQGLEYLHEKANPPVFYGELKPANIWLNEDYKPRLSGYGLAKLVNGDTKTVASSRVMGTNGYCAPEYERQGELNAKSDVYSFGVILLELITGRRALDTTRSTDEQNLVCWAQPMFRDQKKFPEMADPVLEGRFPQKSLNQAIGMAAMCLQEEPSVRPLMGDVVSMLSFLEVAPPPPEEPIPTSLQAPLPPEASRNDDDKRSESSDNESDYSSDSSEDNDTYSQHKIDAKSKRKGSNKSRNSISSNDSSKSFDENVFLDESDDNDNESEVKNSKSELSMNNASSDAPQGHKSMNLRKNSIDSSQAGSIGSSSSSSSSSFVWSIGSRSDHQLHDGSSARRSNSGHISNVAFDNDIHSLNLRQQSIPNA